MTSELNEKDVAVTQGSDPESPTPGDAAEPDADELARVTAERDEYLDLLQRVQADFENYRKRAARDQERLIAHAHERMVRELLPVLDDLERTLDAAERHEEAALVEGVQLVERSLRKALEKEGIVEIEAEGAFDPHVHEAMLTQSRDGAEPGSVLEVVRRGYRLGDKVVRPARVIVAE
ncbi:MAG TPA: nucleotide exchange factor GrpE [Gaiellaceae bacterium]|nr:nucleotide exchange factor GrpE [Gaiellaceae bacterium]